MGHVTWVAGQFNYGSDGSWVRKYDPKGQTETRMWASAQRDGRLAEDRWRPVLNAAKFG